MTDITAFLKEEIDSIINSEEYQIVYDIYDQGSADAGAMQTAIENLHRTISESMARIGEARELEAKDNGQFGVGA